MFMELIVIKNVFDRGKIFILFVFLGFKFSVFNFYEFVK